MKMISKDKLTKIAPLFNGYQSTFTNSAVQGCIGQVWADDEQQPTVAKAILFVFGSFAGDATSNKAKELLMYTPTDYPHSWMGLIAEDAAWQQLIEEVYKGKYQKIIRYSFKKDPTYFDKEKLQQYVDSLPNDYQIMKIDEKLFHELQAQDWSQFHGSQFPNFNMFQQHGAGFVILYDNLPICVASSFIYYKDGIEIQIDTKNEYQKKNLATICASKLILACLEKGLYPNWDASSESSVALAKKLGYQLDKEYVMYGVAVEK